MAAATGPYCRRARQSRSTKAIDDGLGLQRLGWIYPVSAEACEALCGPVAGR